MPVHFGCLWSIVSQFATPEEERYKQAAIAPRSGSSVPTLGHDPSIEAAIGPLNISVLAPRDFHADRSYRRWIQHHSD